MKNVIMSVFIIALLFLIPNFSQATVDYTIDNSNMIINLTGLNLDLSKTYQYTAIAKKEDLSTATWYNLEKENYTSTTAKLNLNILNGVANNSAVYIYVKNTTDNNFMVEGFSVNLLNATVKAIQIISPTAGTYKEGQTIKICVYFDRKITGTIPTLKIKFGDGTERSVINGTIHNDTNVNEYGQYIEYLYNIQSGDNGYLTTLGLEGGNIKDINGNNAILSCPVLTGAISIKAETVIVNEENNKEDDNEDAEETDDIKENEEQEEEEVEDDNTIASGNIPYTGIGYGFLIVISILLILGIIAKIKHNDLKDI